MPRKNTKKTDIAAPEITKLPKWFTGKAPPNPDALNDWLVSVLDVHIGRAPLLPGHAAPFDYLCHSFFEGKLPRPSAPEAAPPTSADAIVWANRGGGKTFLGALATLLDLLFKPGIQMRILGGSLDQSLRMRAYLSGFLLNENLDAIPRRITARRITIVHEKLGKTSTVEVLAASQTSVRGTRVQKLRCDEVDLFDPEVWAAAQLVTRSLPCSGPWGETIRGSVEALSTMHRPFGLMWDLVGPPADDRPGSGEKLRERSVTPRPTFKWGILDTLEHCTAEHTCATCILHPECEGRAKTLIPAGKGGHFAVSDAIAMKARVSLDTWQSEMLCMRPSRSNTVYSAFDAATHVVTELPARFPRYIGGMDFGFRSEGVLLLAGVDGDGGVTVLREHIRTGVVLDDYVDALERWCAEGICDPGDIEFIGVDPAGRGVSDQTGKSCIQILKARGLRIRNRASEIPEGIGYVRARIAPATAGPRLKVHHSCTRLIECLTRYCYDPKRPEHPNPKKDGHDHAPDALRYMILNLDAPSKTECASYL